MFCSKCGASLPDGSRFCGKCGNPVAAQPDAAPTVNAAQSAAPFTPPQNIDPTYGNAPERVDYGSDGTQVLSGLTYPDPRNSSDAGYDNSQNPPTPNYGAPQGYDAQSGYGAQPGYDYPQNFGGQQPGYDYGYVPEKPKKKHTALKIIISIAAVLCIAFVGIGIYTDWFGLNGPLVQLSKAVNELRDDGKSNFTADMRIGALGEEGSVNIQIDVDNDKQTLAMLAEVRYGDEKSYFGIYEDKIIVNSNGESYYFTFDEDLLWDSMAESEDKTLLDLDAESLEDMLKTANLYDDFTDCLDLDTFVNCLHTFASHMNDTKWLKENAGYSTDKEDGTRYYTYDLPIADFAKAVVDDFADAIIYQDDYDNVLDALDRLEDTVSEASCVLRLGVTDGALSNIELAVSEDGEKIECEMEIYDVGSTDVDTDLLADMARDATPLY